MEYIKAQKLISQYTDNNHWFDLNYNMNIYKGCCHGCIYCDSRSECYMIEDFDRVRAKEGAVESIAKELRGKKKKGVIGTGAMSDPYNPFEKQLKLTRGALKEINRNNFGISIATKSPLITRDIDILKEISTHSPVLIKITITTYEDALCKKIEPKVAPSSERFNAIKKLSEAGIYTGILLMPILPFINDNEDNIRSIVREAHRAGARFIYAYGMGLTLRGNQRQYFYEKVNENFKDKTIVKKYIEAYGNDYQCPSPQYKDLWKAFVEECEKYNILYKMKDIIKGYRKGYEQEQISFL